MKKLSLKKVLLTRGGISAECLRARVEANAFCHGEIFTGGNRCEEAQLMAQLICSL